MTVEVAKGGQRLGKHNRSTISDFQMFVPLSFFEYGMFAILFLFNYFFLILLLLFFPGCFSLSNAQRRRAALG
jgi:ascorbate-specific PTS system EIIC-type component UlaA